jgi:preprotein translocase subunit YajC
VAGVTRLHFTFGRPGDLSRVDHSRQAIQRTGVDNVLAILPLVGIALLFWLILIRPQQRRQRDLVAMQHRVEAGDQVMLTSGIYGSVLGLDDTDDTVSLSVADGVTLRVARAAIGSVVRPEAAAPDDDAGLADHTADEPEEK